MYSLQRRKLSVELKLSDKQLNKSSAKRIKQLLAITNQEPIIDIIIIVTRKQTELYIILQ